MLTNESLLLKWNGLSKYAGGFMRIDPVHPLELYLGYEGINQRSLLLISSEEPSCPPSSKSILVNAGQRSDGRWAVTFRLIRSEQEEVFIQLCCDLIESARLQRNDPAGVQFFLNRYRLWHKLMEHGGSGLMGEAARKGLLGELLFLQQLLSAGMPAAEAVRGWVGPEKADRDFAFASGWYEIKTAGASAKTVTITSLEQLDASPPGELVVFLIDHAAPDEIGSFSLNGKIDEIRTILAAESVASSLFGAKLESLGYIPLTAYDLQHYRLHGIRRYTVDGGFPRLTKQSVPSQIVGASYEISLSAIENWRIE